MTNAVNLKHLMKKMTCLKSKPAGYRNVSAVGLAALLAATTPLCAADAPATYDPAFVEKLIHRLESAEGEIRALKAKPAAPATAVEMPSLPQAAYPSLQFHGFGDIEYQAANRAVNNTAQTTGVNYQQAGNSPGSYNQFYLGELDLFVSSQLSDKFSSLIETVIAAGTDNHWGIDVERLELSWNPSEYFNVDIGRYHTQMGYYNTAYHHGTWFQTAVGRPSFLEFEDSGGLIPVHSVGFSIHGAVPSGNLNVNYFFEVANGRAYPTDGSGPVQNLLDGNGLKAINFALVAKPDWFSGGQFGAGIYHDTVTPPGMFNTDELIPNAHIVYHGSVWELMAEGFLIRHAPKFGSAHYTPMGYVQAARKMGLFTPYGRFTYYNASRNDAIYSMILQHAGAHYGPSFGLRYDISAYVALKAQYDLMFDTGQRNASAVTLQAAFTF